MKGPILGIVKGPLQAWLNLQAILSYREPTSVRMRTMWCLDQLSAACNSEEHKSLINRYDTLEDCRLTNYRTWVAPCVFCEEWIIMGDCPDVRLFADYILRNRKLTAKG